MEQLSKKQIKKFFKKQKRDKEVVLILENIQYARNVAGIFRTADAAGVSKIFLTGISKTPPFGKELSKASRSKEKSVQWEYEDNTAKTLQKLKKEGFFLIAVELTNEAEEAARLSYLVSDKDKIAFVLGSEVYGVTNSTLSLCNTSVFLPMYGKGASLNVATTAGIILYSF
ncbi:tRNA methyltransferase [Candidatus Dojkabacteria bacterium]|uniref:tRNA methyltransferase n=1 Tax=Candidatus Dojkabacteria bacterium TaxID=2099670 RepID=A0A955LAI2_9BACT|nr:tRNA methyltransferase [Candidatus Dojkabacteria bacterium]